jgi:hypothetical protein
MGADDRSVLEVVLVRALVGSVPPSARVAPSVGVGNVGAVDCTASVATGVVAVDGSSESVGALVESMLSVGAAVAVEGSVELVGALVESMLSVGAAVAVEGSVESVGEAVESTLLVGAVGVAVDVSAVPDVGRDVVSVVSGAVGVLVTGAVVSAGAEVVSVVGVVSVVVAVVVGTVAVSVTVEVSIGSLTVSPFEILLCLFATFVTSFLPLNAAQVTGVAARSKWGQFPREITWGPAGRGVFARPWGHLQAIGLLVTSGLIPREGAAKLWRRLRSRQA